MLQKALTYLRYLITRNLGVRGLCINSRLYDIDIESSNENLEWTFGSGILTHPSFSGYVLFKP